MLLIHGSVCQYVIKILHGRKWLHKLHTYCIQSPIALTLHSMSVFDWRYNSHGSDTTLEVTQPSGRKTLKHSVVQPCRKTVDATLSGVNGCWSYDITICRCQSLMLHSPPHTHTLPIATLPDLPSELLIVLTVTEHPQQMHARTTC